MVLLADRWDSVTAKAQSAELLDSHGYGVMDAGPLARPLADSWRQQTTTPVWGTPLGPYSEELGQPEGEDWSRAELASAKR